MSDPGQLRLGWRAALADTIAAAIAMSLAYLLRFGRDEAWHFAGIGWPLLLLAIGLQVSVAAMAGLYRVRGQVMWPIRLAVGGLAGALVVLLLVTWAGAGEGVSRQALIGQAAVFGLVAVIWRVLVGLKVRQRQARDFREQFGGQALVVQGAEVGSMAGALARTWDYRHLLSNLLMKDLKLKYQRSLLGFAWSLLNPLLMILVYTLAFTYVMKVQTPRFVFFILIGVLAWTFFGSAVSSATDAVTGSGSFLRSVVFPRVVLPLSTVLFALAQYLLTTVVFLPLMLVLYQVPLEPRMLLFPVFLALQVLFIAGISLAISTATAVFRDVKHLVEVGLGIGFWATPILYEPTMVPEQFRPFMLLGPMTPYIRAYQDIFYYGVTPELAVWVVATVYAAGMFICGLSVFLAYEDRFTEFV
ncbi:MAG: ABC transporter permease [Acidobacteria bacterium]|nr:ABC transporter permease [Acidobacteriota bacterium]